MGMPCHSMLCSTRWFDISSVPKPASSDSAISSPPENASKSLQDVMSEQLAEKLVKDQSNQSQRKELERQLSENGFDQDEIEKAIQMSLSLNDSTEKRDTESSVGKQESNTNFLISEIKDQFVEPKFGGWRFLVTKLIY